MVIHRCIFKINLITLFRCFALPKTSMGLPKTRVSFDCEAYIGTDEIYQVTDGLSNLDDAFKSMFKGK